MSHHLILNKILLFFIKILIGSHNMIHNVHNVIIVNKSLYKLCTNRNTFIITIFSSSSGCLVNIFLAVLITNFNDLKSNT